MEKLTLENAKTLILNADMAPLSWNPLSIWVWQDAVSSVFKGKAYVVENYDTLLIRSPSIEIPVPSVIALTNYVYASHHVRFTRYNVYTRDNFTCAYCNEKFEAQDLTFDHKIPRVKGGITSWTNIITACTKCNQIKNDKLLEDGIFYPKSHKLSGQRMKLNYQPYVPTAEGFRRKNKLNLKNTHESWQSWLSWNADLEED